MPTGASGAKNNDGGRVGGARADFVASLGRKVNDARELLGLLEEDPTAKGARDELRRRLHALGAGARLLRFGAMTSALQEVLAVLDRSSQTGSLQEPDVSFVGQVLDDLPALAWGDITPTRETSAGSGGHTDNADRELVPIAALVVGGESLAATLTEVGQSIARPFECERTDDVDKALELARGHAPDLIVVDTDVTRSPELVESLLDDPLTDPVPVVVVGAFRSPEEVARFVALGVTRTLTKPVSSELLRATCHEILDAYGERTTRVTLGEPTLEQLGDRLAEELRHALVESVDPATRAQRVPLGEGTDVLAALWGTIARVQEIVTRKTGGAIRFGGDTPEGAIALAPWMHQDVPATERITGRPRGDAGDVRLTGRRVVVADDDPGVTWFVSDLLRTAGCEVHEALDGTTALDLAFRVQPELVVSDILMPGIDGFALCRALRRDVALRDTPVILLSWKEDLLQRVRELGASAAAYLRKESSSRAILARVREVLRPRARMELRLRNEGEVRGRLDGITPRLLLDLVCLIRKNARVSIRDATHLYEVEIREGAPRRATRSASDGSSRSGEQALSGLLGVGAGRFVVTPSSEPIDGDLTGTLYDQLLRPIALARGALVATTGVRMTTVERIAFDEQALAWYLRATPEPTRTLIRRLAQGVTARQILLSGEASPSLLEDVLSDLAARGAILAVQGANGVDILTPGVDAALAVLRGSPATLSLPPNARPSAPAPPRRSVPDGERAPARRSVPDSERDFAPPRRSVSDGECASPPPRLSTSPAPTDVAALAQSQSPDHPPNTIVAVPSSLEDAVMREISGLSTQARTRTSDTAPIVRPSELKPRFSNPPDDDTVLDPGDESLGVIPPDAIVPGLAGSHEIGEVSGAPVLEAPTDARSPGRVRSKYWPLVLAIGLLMVVIAVVSQWARPGPPSTGTAVAPTSTADPSGLANAGPPTASAPPPGASPPTSSGVRAEDDLPPGAEVPPGFGLLEVRAPAGAVVRIDGTVAGTGPYAASVAAPGYHEVRVKQGARESTQVIEVRSGKASRVRSP